MRQKEDIELKSGHKNGVYQEAACSPMELLNVAHERQWHTNGHGAHASNSSDEATSGLGQTHMRTASSKVSLVAVVHNWSQLELGCDCDFCLQDGVKKPRAGSSKVGLKSPERLMKARTSTTSKIVAKLFSRQKQTKEIDANGHLELAQLKRNDPITKSRKEAANGETDEDRAENVRQTSGGEVIEFKFDLIVERGKLQDSLEFLINDRKLRDQVNELVESLVFDSNDVCLMNLGPSGQWTKRSAQNNEKSQSGGSAEQLIELAKEDQNFDQALELTRVSFTYAFELLKASANCKKVRKESKGIGILGGKSLIQNPSTTPEVGHDFNQEEEEEDYSIDISATLFFSHSNCVSGRKSFEKKTHSTIGKASTPTQSNNSGESLGPLEFVDLLDLNEHRNGQATFHAERSTTERIDDEREFFYDGNGQSSKLAGTFKGCKTIEQALQCLAFIKGNLDSLFKRACFHDHQRTNRLLLITLKLKQNINSGLFSNRMCLLDLCEPDGSQLRSMVESIFSGQALAHLRKRAQHLETEKGSDKIGSVITQSQWPSNGGSDNMDRQHENDANLMSKLIRAEWLLYKQLSSALIRTLVLVNVVRINKTIDGKKLKQTPSTCFNGEALVNTVLAHNLSLLKFAHNIQRASARRLKRRQRNLARRARDLASRRAPKYPQSEALFTMGRAGIRRSRALHQDRPLPRNYLGASNLSLLMNSDAGRLSSASNETEDQLRPSDLVVVSKSRTNQMSSFQKHVRKFSLTERVAFPSCQPSTAGADRGVLIGNLDQRFDNFHHSLISPRWTDKQEGTADWVQVPSTRASHRLQNVDYRSTSGRSDSLALTESSSVVSSESSGPENAANAGHNVRQQTATHWWLKYQHKQRSSSNEPTSSTLVQQPPSAPGRVANLIGSDTDDSLISACMNTSCASSSNNSSFMQTASQQRQPESLCRPDGVPPRRSTFQENDLRDIQGHLESDDACEDESRLVSVAEPPQQLKLEQFLSQLNQVIQQSPRLDKSTDDMHPQAPSEPLEALQLGNLLKRVTDFELGDVANGLKDEDDDDCKSHSSILEHLSSLALETKQRHLYK